MLNKFKAILVSLATVFVIGAPLAVTATVSADTTANVQSSVCEGAANLAIPSNAQPTTACNSLDNNTVGTSKINDLLAKIINIFSIIVGVVAVIMIIYGGFRYITSGGTAEKITSAKNTILYALIGLIIVALAQVIVKFVLTRTV